MASLFPGPPITRDRYVSLVDGRSPRDEVGSMLMTYEGWQFKLEVRDKSEEL
jgi:hypothetical protein